MIPAGYKNALVTYAQTKGSAGVAAIDAEFDALFTLMNQRRGTELINSSVNGKTFGYQVNMTVEEKFSAVGEAIRELNGDRIVATCADFRGLCR